VKHLAAKEAEKTKAAVAKASADSAARLSSSGSGGGSVVATQGSRVAGTEASFSAVEEAAAAAALEAYEKAQEEETEMDEERLAVRSIWEEREGGRVDCNFSLVRMCRAATCAHAWQRFHIGVCACVHLCALRLPSFVLHCVSSAFLCECLLPLVTYSNLFYFYASSPTKQEGRADPGFVVGSGTDLLPGTWSETIVAVDAVQKVTKGGQILSYRVLVSE